MNFEDKKIYCDAFNAFTDEFLKGVRNFFLWVTDTLGENPPNSFHPYIIHNFLWDFLRPSLSKGNLSSEQFMSLVKDIFDDAEKSLVERLNVNFPEKEGN